MRPTHLSLDVQARTNNPRAELLLKNMDGLVPNQFTTRYNPEKRAFTLVELLTVLSIASILSVLVSAGLQGIMGSAYSNETADFANTLVRARAYAMANNTYVFVGIQEVDASKNSAGTQSVGIGRVAVTAVASNDGTRDYLPSAPSALDPTKLSVIFPLRHFENLHLSTTAAPNLPNANSGTSYKLASTGGTTPSPSLTTFSWPLTGPAQYASFGTSTAQGTVIQFNPQGEAQIVTGANTDAILQWIEIDLVPTHGNAVSGNNPNPATILIDGASGSVSAFRA